MTNKADAAILADEMIRAGTGTAWEEGTVGTRASNEYPTKGNSANG